MVGWCAVYLFFISDNSLGSSPLMGLKKSICQVAPPVCTMTLPFFNVLITASLRR